MSLARAATPAPQVPLPDAGPAGFSRALALRACLVFVACAALAAGLATLTSGSGSGTQPNAATPNVPAVQAVPGPEAARFAILRAPRSASDAIDPVRAGAGPLGANIALARSVREPRGGLSAGLVFVVPARGAVCLRVPFSHLLAQWWCQHTAAAASGRLLMAVRPGGPLRASNQLIIGLVPDGVPSVLVTAAGGVRRSVAVRRNVYETQIYAPRSITIRLPGHRGVSYAAP